MPRLTLLSLVALTGCDLDAATITVTQLLNFDVFDPNPAAQPHTTYGGGYALYRVDRIENFNGLGAYNFAPDKLYYDDPTQSGWNVSWDHHMLAVSWRAGAETVAAGGTEEGPLGCFAVQTDSPTGTYRYSLSHNAGLATGGTTGGAFVNTQSFDVVAYQGTAYPETLFDMCTGDCSGDEAYLLPFANDPAWTMTNGNWDDPLDPGHGGSPNGLQAFAWDFVYDSDQDNVGEEGVAVLATRAGVVFDLEESESLNNPTCTDPCNPGVGNYVVIDHGDGTFGTYWHLQVNSVPVAVGDPVDVGDRVGRVGNTGCSSTPHLHFDVRTGWDVNYACNYLSESPSLRVRFQDRAHACWIPREGDALASSNTE